MLAAILIFGTSITTGCAGGLSRFAPNLPGLRSAEIGDSIDAPSGGSGTKNALARYQSETETPVARTASRTSWLGSRNSCATNS